MNRCVVVCIPGLVALLVLFWPCEELLCWDTAGERKGTWSETSCDGYEYSGRWSAVVTDDCRFIGNDEWDAVTGAIDPTTGALAASGTIRTQCGSVELTGTCQGNLASVSGSYRYSNGGDGTFIGQIKQP